MTKHFLIMKREHPYGKGAYFLRKFDQPFLEKIKKLKKRQKKRYFRE
tara:strand:+ start:3508 stop:3648 length:141 start_codon:yes stop_codon:yes gene_type:complete